MSLLLLIMLARIWQKFVNYLQESGNIELMGEGKIKIFLDIVMQN